MELKKEYKKISGQEWKPVAVVAEKKAKSPADNGQQKTAAGPDNDGIKELSDKIAAQGNLVRELKGKDPKAVTD